VPFEVLDAPLDGGPTRVEHTEERCRFHRFWTPPRTEQLGVGALGVADGVPQRAEPARPRRPRIDKTGIRPVERLRRVD
jgi:hypothetical protein